MTKRSVIVVVSITLVIIAAFWMHDSALPRAPRHWDLSKSHSISVVPWPKNTYVWDPTASFETNGRVIVDFPGGKRFDRYTEVVVFNRHDDEILAVTFLLEPQTAGDAYYAALAFARYWGVQTSAIDAWHARATSGTPASGGAGIPLHGEFRRNDLPQPVSIEIGNSYQADKPFRVWLQIAWRLPQTRAVDEGKRTD